MSTSLVSLVLELPGTVKGVYRSPPEKLLLLLLAEYSDDDGECWVSRKLLTERTGFRENGIELCMKSLIEEGWVEKVDCFSFAEEPMINRYILSKSQLMHEVEEALNG